MASSTSHSSTPSSRSPTPRVQAPIWNKVVSKPFQHVAAAAEAVRVITLLLVQRDEPNRLERAQRATAHAETAAEVTHRTAEGNGTASAQINAETASALAETANLLLTLF